MRRPFRKLDYEKSVGEGVGGGGAGCGQRGDRHPAVGGRKSASAGRFAAEVVCLQTATQFGDRSCEPRLTELKEMVEGPRVGLAAQVRRGACATATALNWPRCQ